MGNAYTNPWWQEAPPPQKKSKRVLVGRKRRPWVTILALIVLAAGLGVLLYPTAENIVYDAKMEQQKKIFLQADVKADLLYKYLKAENEHLYESGQSGLADAFSYEQPAIDLSTYGIKDNTIGIISLPAIKIELPIFLGANTANMKKGAAHLTQTSYPIGGDNTNCVIAAHRGRTVKMFRNIHKMKVGDEVIITNFREVLTYRVTGYKIIDPSEISDVLIQPGKDRLTLSTCNPIGANYERYLLFCERVK